MSKYGFLGSGNGNRPRLALGQTTNILGGRNGWTVAQTRTKLDWVELLLLGCSPRDDPNSKCLISREMSWSGAWMSLRASSQLVLPEADGVSFVEGLAFTIGLMLMLGLANTFFFPTIVASSVDLGWFAHVRNAEIKTRWEARRLCNCRDRCSRTVIPNSEHSAGVKSQLFSAAISAVALSSSTFGSSLLLAAGNSATPLWRGMTCMWR
jgi:hypothetical protein